MSVQNTHAGAAAIAAAPACVFCTDMPKPPCLQVIYNVRGNLESFSQDKHKPIE